LVFYGLVKVLFNQLKLFTNLRALFSHLGPFLAIFEALYQPSGSFMPFSTDFDTSWGLEDLFGKF
jgi:hypothetical protein